MLFPTFFVTLFIWLFNQKDVDLARSCVLFAVLWLFGFGMLGVSMFGQNFFRNSQLVAMVMPFIFFIPTGISMVLVLEPVISQTPNDWIQYLFWFPTFPFAVCAVDLLNATEVEYFSVQPAVAWAFLVIQCPLYFLLHMYMEAILPDNYGIRKGVCCCFAGCRKRSRLNATVEAQSLEMQQVQEGQSLANVAASDERGLISSRAHMQTLDESDPIKLKRVTMQFGNFKAVDRMSLSIKENEIMALLGHNGAGKTTAIYMLTGMLDMTSGDASIYGKSVRRQIDEVRKSIGLCQQLDVLYELMSVEEHLKMTLRVRFGQVDTERERSQINDILTRCQLTEHKDKLVKQCSGGMKRKLSLGMALIGETKTIILDEPTSGLDVESREQMWNLIRSLKQGRSIIMSTQHIEEADELADRVCIMSHGRVISLDTPDQIKRKFGVGYNVYVEAKHQYENTLDAAGLKAMFDRVRAIFLNVGDLPDIEESADSNDKKLIIMVPSAYVHRISSLIAQVEQNVLEAQIDIELNSLEDAFIKIAENDIKEEEKKSKEIAQRDRFMSAEDEENALRDYFEYEGRQNCC